MTPLSREQSLVLNYLMHDPWGFIARRLLYGIIETYNFYLIYPKLLAVD
jgi:hypothetical protein